MMNETPEKQQSKEAFDLYIVGLGIVGVRQITREVESVLRRSREVLFVDPGFGVQDFLAQTCEKVTDLVPISYREAEARIDAYDRIATAVLEAALDHPPVTFAVYGHPLVYVYPSTQLLRAARLLEIRVQVLPGISTLDALLIDVGLDPGFSGLQMYEATDLLLRDRPLQPDVPCILWQVGAVETLLHSTAPSSPQRFERLQAHLLKFYPSDHQITVIYTSIFPLAPSDLTRFPLAEFAARFPQLPQGATVYLPSVRLREVGNLDLFAEIGSIDHLDRITTRGSSHSRVPKDPFTPSSGIHLATEYVVHENFLSPEEQAELLGYCQQREHDFVESKVIQPGSAAGSQKPEYRRSLVLHDLGHWGALITNRVRLLLPRVLEQLGLPLFQPTKIEAQLTATNDGEFFKAHNDNTHDLLLTRRVTFVYYFYHEPGAFTGGDLKIYETHFVEGRYVATETCETLAAVQNRIVFFPSVLMHEVMATSCPSHQFIDSRFTVNGWIHA
jgi:Rps23 Pro-64 3,4-dihydroxylase Tpa1-like proline 4-hydroxylase